MSELVTTRQSIVDISEDFRQSERLTVPDLHDVTVPIQAPLSCELSFESARVARGARLILTFNGEDAGEINYEGEARRQQVTIDLTERLVEGANDFRVRALVSCFPGDLESDLALVWLKSGDTTIIRKAYTTRGSLEPFDQRWTLWYEAAGRR